MPNTENERKYFSVNFDIGKSTTAELLEAHRELRRIFSKISWEIATRERASHKYNSPSN